MIFYCLIQYKPSRGLVVENRRTNKIFTTVKILLVAH